MCGVRWYETVFVMSLLFQTLYVRVFTCLFLQAIAVATVYFCCNTAASLSVLGLDFVYFMVLSFFLLLDFGVITTAVNCL